MDLERTLRGDLYGIGRKKGRGRELERILRGWKGRTGDRAKELRE